MASEEEKNKKLTEESLKIKKEQLQVDREILRIMQRRSGLGGDEIKLQRDISNVLQDQVKHLTLSANEKRKIRNITRQLNDLAEKTYTFDNKSLGTATSSEKIQKQILAAQQKMKVLGLQRSKINDKESKTYVAQAALRREINAGIVDQIALSSRVVQQLEKQAEVAKSIEGDNIANSFGVMGDVLGKIPGLSVLAPAFKSASEEARKVGAEVELFSKGMVDASEFSKANLAKMGPDAKVLSKSTYSADDKAVKRMQKKDPEKAKAMIGQRKELFGAAAQKALEAGTAELKGVNKTMLQLNASFKEISGLIGKLVAVMLVKSLFEANQNVTNIKRNLAVGNIEARELNFQFNAIAAASNDLRVNLKNLFAASSALNQQYGTALMFNEETLKTSAQLLDAKIMEGEQVAMLSMQSRINGQTMDQSLKTQEQAVNAVNKENNTRISLKGVLKDSAKINGQIAAQLGGNPKAIAAAVTQAKALGMELKDVAAAGKQLLDFESSIENELTAELMLGRQLNLEKARLAALTGDYETLTKEINANVGDFGDFMKLNVLQQDALAASVGMTTDQLSNQLMKKANLEELAEEALDRGDKQQYLDLKALSTQEKFEAAVLKVKDAFVGVMSVLEPIVLAVGFVADMMGTLPGQLVMVVGGFMALAKAARIFKALEIGAAIASIFKSSFGRLHPFIAIATSLAGVAALIMTVQKYSKAGDVMSPADGKTQISTKEGGLFELSKNDDVAAGPGILDKLKGAMKGGPMGLMGGMMGMLNPFSGLTSIISNMAEAIIAKFDVIVGTMSQQLLSEPIPVTVMATPEGEQVQTNGGETQMSALEKKLDEIKVVLQQQKTIKLDVNNNLKYDSFEENTTSYVNGKAAQEAINDSSFV